MRRRMMGLAALAAGVVGFESAAVGQYAEAWNAKVHVSATDVGVDVAADPSKYSFTTGWVSGTGSKTSIKVRAYDTNGVVKDTVTWGPYNGPQKPHAMAIVPVYEMIDGVGTHVKTYVYVTGEGPRSTLADQDMVTLLWVFDLSTETFESGGVPVLDRYHNYGNDIGWDIAVAGSYVVATGSSAGSLTGLDTVTIAFNQTTLARIWSAPDRYNYNNHDDAAVSVSAGPPSNTYSDSTVVIAGYSSNGSTDSMLLRQLKLADGSHLQTWRRNLPGDARATAVTWGDVNGIFVTGWTTLSLGIGEAPDTITVYRNYLTARNEQGNLFPVWSDIYQGAAALDDIAYSIAYSDYFDIDNVEHRAVYVGGASWQSVSNDYDVKLLRYAASDGHEDWTFSDPTKGASDGNLHLADECFDIGVDAQGKPYATGRSIQAHSSVNAFDFATMRFGEVSGDRGDSGKFNPLYFNGTANGDDSANAVEVWQWDNAPDPDAWTAGQRTDTSEGLNIGTVKYFYVP